MWLRFLKSMIPVTGLLASLSSCSDQVKESDAPAQEVDGGALSSENFVEGNLFFLAYHELGHALVSEFDLPIAGREEDAVDRIAIWMMTPENEEELPEYLLSAMDGWMALATQTPLDEIAWWDEHGTDQQRGYQIACLLYGSNPTRFKDVAKAAELPEERMDSCEFEAEENFRVWDRLLAEHFKSTNGTQNPAAATIEYSPTENHALEQAYLKRLGLLEHINDLMSDDFRFKPGIRLVAEDCGEPNAFWHADERKLTICYELVGDYQALAAK